MAPVVRIRTEAGETSMDLDEFEGRVRRGELAGHCLVQFTPLTGESFVRADELELFRKLFRPKALYFARAFNLNRFPKITAALVVAEIAVYVAMTLQGPVDQDALVAWGARVGPLIFDLGETWRLLSANFLHQGVLHIAFNLFVLFNVGGALENAYRPLGYAMLLLSSALGTTLVSLWALPDAMTVGASGVVYGTFGAAVVFGVKYRELLPRRYRSVLGEANLPTVLAFLYIGFTSTGVDNWAHVGGLLTGAATALGLEPRLLAEGKPTRRRRALLVAPVVLAILGLGGFGAWVFVRGPRMQLVTDDGMGLRLEVPGSWVKGTERFGQLAYHNGLVGVGRASFSVQARPRGGQGLDELVRGYVERVLTPEERAGALRDLVVQPPRGEAVAGREGRLLEASYSEEGGTIRMQAHFVQRGEQVYELVYAWSDRYPRYRAVAEASAATVALVEPGLLRELRAQALLAPSTATLAELGRTLTVLGEQGGAVAALSWAVDQRPEDGESHVRLSEALLGAGRVEEACRAAEAGVGFRPDDPAALATMSECKKAQGDKAGAVRYLQRAIEAEPRDEALKARLDALQ